MNRLILSILGLVLMAVLPACDKEDYDGGPIYVYLLHIKAVDAEGRDLVDGITHGPIDAEGYCDVATDEYTLSGPEWLAPASVYVGEDGAESFVLNGFLYDSDFVATLTCELACPHIFGDDAAHEIVSQWRKEDGKPTCTAVTVDGSDCPVGFAGYINNYKTFETTVVIPRR